MTISAAADSPPTRPGELVAANIRAEIARRRWSQRDLAAALGWAQSRLNDRVTGKTECTVGDVVRIARALDVPPSRLFDGIDETTEG